MPFDPLKKKTPRVGPPTYEQERALWALDAAFAELVKVLTFVSSNCNEMRNIIATLRGPINNAKKWVLEEL